jgi:hypothetical protein
LRFGGQKMPVWRLETESFAPFELELRKKVLETGCGADIYNSSFEMLWLEFVK